MMFSRSKYLRWLGAAAVIMIALFAGELITIDPFYKLVPLLVAIEGLLLVKYFRVKYGK